MTMQKAQELIDKMVQQFAELQVKRKPKLVWNVEGKSRESVAIDWAGGELRVVANEERNLCFALNQVCTAFSHIGEYLGIHSPRFPLRVVKLENPMEPICKKLALHGFNGVITDKSLPLCHSYGLKVYSLHESGVLNFQETPSDFTVAERVYQELRDVEGIYYLPVDDETSAKKQARWFSDLLDNAGLHTLVAFPARVGEALHPIWNTLRQSRDISSTPLLPMIDVALVPQILPRLERHRFAGVIGSGAMGERELWSAGQALWHGKNQDLSVETWDCNLTQKVLSY